ncbi:lipopolysaccharide biosynthesis protein [Luteitalea sp. TBR-22]|uniref:lipopolysaccharide biosynthesis protein n=1 Tax=Luteitalea sp. TBR-22 TaxID=2802971 RepID=UPI001AF35807|nr:lipopolysaccharide biosynthesis protein [Luteitalea sp. TBR-22]BCS36062.1 lipopolysaccharide biosynthesis protein [Luteitalea sp. TBR-22]
MRQAVLGRQVITGGILTALAQGAKAGLGILSAMVLARLLAPQDFGLVAMVASVASLLRIFRDAGLSTATIQRDSISQAQVSNLFWVNVGIGAVLALTLAASGPLIGAFYRDSRLPAIAVALALGFVLSGGIVQHQALLARSLRFGRLAAIEVASGAVSLVVAVVLASAGWGYWSLIASSLALEACTLVLTWSASGWRPRLPARGVGTRELLSFGASMTAGSLLHILSRNVDNVLLGRVHGAEVVGLYSRAYILLMRPVDQFLMPIGPVIVPALSRLNGDPARYRRAFLRFYGAVALVGFPFAGICLALAGPMTLVLLGPRWSDSAPVFRAFSLAALFLPLAAPSGWLLISQGRAREYVGLNAAVATVSIASYVAGVRFGAVGVAYSYSVASLLLSLPVLFHICGRRGPVLSTDLWSVFWRHAPLWCLAFAVASSVSSSLNSSTPLVQLLSGVGSASLAVIGVLMVVPAYRRNAQVLLSDGVAALKSYAGGSRVVG